MRKILLGLMLVAGFVVAGTLTTTGVTCVIGATGDTTCLPSSGPIPPIPPLPPSQNCAQQGYTVIPSSPIGLAWGRFNQAYSKDSGTFGPNTVWLFTITPPAGTGQSTIYGSVVVSEYQGPATGRQISFSKTPCDFSASAVYVSQVGNTANAYFGTGVPVAGAAILTPGTTYYVSVRNAGGCASGNCPALANINPASP